MSHRDPDEDALALTFRAQAATVTDADLAALTAFAHGLSPAGGLSAGDGLSGADGLDGTAVGASVLAGAGPVRRRSRWVWPLVAAAAVVVVLAGVLVLLRPGPSPIASSPPPELIVTGEVSVPFGPSVVNPGLLAPTSDETSVVAVALAEVTYLPALGATEVRPRDPVVVRVANGRLQDDLRLVAGDGTVIAGVLEPDGSAWTPGQRLEYATTYTFEGSYVDQVGESHLLGGSFATIAPSGTTGAKLNIPDGEVVGIAAPIVVTFDRPVADKAAAEAALTVTTSQGEALQGSWGWLQDEDFEGTGVQSQVHWRPTVSPAVGGFLVSGENSPPYWPAGTKVSVSVDLVGVDLGDGYWGATDLRSSFSVRPDARIALADWSSHHLVVVVNGEVVKNYPVAFGELSVPGKVTSNGIHVVMNKYPEFKMCNEDFGYCGTQQRWAVRINNNGEFIHENTSVTDSLGKDYVAHGAINLGSPDAEEFYHDALYGDPVEIVNAPGYDLSERDYLYDWIYSPDEWRALSAGN